MSATIMFRIVKPPEGHISVGHSSAFVEAMTRAFGPPPWILGGPHLVTLRGMAAVEGSSRQNNPYESMIGKIEGDDGSTCEIEVWPEY